MSGIVLTSPYRGMKELRRLRGSWHNHMHKSEIRPEQAVEICVRGGYDFVGVTDHDTRYRALPWSDADWMKCRTDGLLVVRGFEITHPLGHVTCLGLSPADIEYDLDHLYDEASPDQDGDAVYDAYLDRARKGGAFLSFAHPALWRDNPEALLRMPALRLVHGIEIYNGNRMKKGWDKAYAGDVVDLCLGAGIRLWTAANPDCHAWNLQELDNPFHGYSVAFAKESTRQALLEALSVGRFYASTGLEVDTIEVGAGDLKVHAPGCTRAVFIGSGGKVVGESRGPDPFYRFTGEEAYVRTELESETVKDRGAGNAPARAWLQPVWVQRRS